MNNYIVLKSLITVKWTRSKATHPQQNIIYFPINSTSIQVLYINRHGYCCTPLVPSYLTICPAFSSCCILLATPYLTSITQPRRNTILLGKTGRQSDFLACRTFFFTVVTGSQKATRNDCQRYTKALTNGFMYCVQRSGFNQSLLTSLLHLHDVQISTIQLNYFKGSLMIQNLCYYQRNIKVSMTYSQPPRHNQVNERRTQ